MDTLGAVAAKAPALLRGHLAQVIQISTPLLASRHHDILRHKAEMVLQHVARIDGDAVWLALAALVDVDVSPPHASLSRLGMRRGVSQAALADAGTVEAATKLLSWLGTLPEPDWSRDTAS